MRLGNDDPPVTSRIGAVSPAIRPTPRINPRDHAGQRRRQHDAFDRLPLADPECGACVPVLVGDAFECLPAGNEHEREEHEPEHDHADEQGVRVAESWHEKREAEESEDDAGGAPEAVGRHLDEARKAALLGVFGEEHRSPDS